MIEIEELKKHLSSFEQKSARKALPPLLGISLPQKPEKQTLCLIKEKSLLSKFLESDKNTEEMFLLVNAKLMEEQSVKELASKALWFGVTENFDKTICEVSKVFYDWKFKDISDLVDGRQLGNCEIDPSAEISQGVFIGQNVVIGANVKILPGCVVQSHCEIESGSVLFSNVTLYPFTKIKKGCRIHSGTSIGSDGFGYNFYEGVHNKMWHHGGVVVEEDVEIGANCAIDMGTFTPTVIGAGSKIDNLVQIAHNVQIGKCVVLCGMSGVAGSASLGDYTVMGGKAALGPDCHLGPGCQIAGGAMVNKSWPAKSMVGGYPARDLKDWKRGLIQLKKLTEKNSRN
ncbi:MAG: UDP-3-O-(3-hydroxymyristoyl)glucosamine N-acyltransferase [Halobacteriovoraceae bacterium]|nr:UDP-3-O-(3-hydroxymyristoyl)glucosamine N-acyltransferase [Halobacteriovoraceae bacterium]MCB9095480.1 UDP-3-O-(3-hydroxymyristoyl)glucosamine N-acyltransferase [Halobacteriovoraceae bacterium]